MMQWGWHQCGAFVEDGRKHPKADAMAIVCSYEIGISMSYRPCIVRHDLVIAATSDMHRRSCKILDRSVEYYCQANLPLGRTVTVVGEWNCMRVKVSLCPTDAVASGFFSSLQVTICDL